MLSSMTRGTFMSFSEGKVIAKQRSKQRSNNVSFALETLNRLTFCPTFFLGAYDYDDDDDGNDNNQNSKEKAGFIAGKHIKSSSKWWFQPSSRRNWKGGDSENASNKKEEDQA